jgi:hypothetical protein
MCFVFVRAQEADFSYSNHLFVFYGSFRSPRIFPPKFRFFLIFLDLGGGGHQAIGDLRQEKFRLDADLKSTDLKLITYYQELLLLRQFEGTENALAGKLSKTKADKASVVADIADCQDKLQGRLAEILAWQERDKNLFNEFSLAVGGDKSEFYPALLKIYRRKIKRGSPTNSLFSSLFSCSLLLFPS